MVRTRNCEWTVSSAFQFEDINAIRRAVPVVNGEPFAESTELQTMTTDQAILFALLFFVFVFLIWGRWRYDLVAFVALLVALLTGIVPKEEAFTGFGHPATVIIALVLVISKGLSNSGAIASCRHI